MLSLDVDKGELWGSLNSSSLTSSFFALGLRSV